MKIILTNVTVFVMVYLMLALPVAQAASIAPIHGKGFFGISDIQETQQPVNQDSTPSIIAYVLQALMGMLEKDAAGINSYHKSTEATTVSFQGACGNQVCEGPGENSINCCWDCPCTTGLYCDGASPSTASCQPLNEVQLVYISPDPISPVNICSGDDSFNVVVELLNFPTGLYEGDVVRSYTLGSLGQTLSTACTGPDANNKYTCTITVPEDSSTCSGTASPITGNSIKFDLMSFPDGPRAPMIISRSAGIPDIPISTFVHGDGTCDAPLGEDYTNSCYDCECPDTQFCDAPAGTSSSDPAWACRIKPTNTNLIVSATDPNFFPEHNPSGNDVTFNYQLTNFPAGSSGAIVSSQDCSIISCNDGVGACTGTCNIIFCNDVGSGDPDTVSRDCTARVTINNHNSSRSYSITPQLEVSANFMDGSRQDGAVLIKSLNSIVFGSFFCGDDVVNSGETFQTCCFDAGCSASQYCDGDPAGPRQDYSCTMLPTSSSNFQASSLNPNFFPVYDASGALSEFTYNITVPVRPGVIVTGESCGVTCSTPGGTCNDASCVVDSCGNVQYGQNGIGRTCQLRFFIPNHIPTNSYTLNPTFGLDLIIIDGEDPVTMSLSKNLEVVGFGPFFCGDETVQEGETSSNCCYDAGCEAGFYCDGDSEAAKDTFTCRSLPSDTNLLFNRVRPTSFSNYDPAGNDVNVEYRISNFPLGDGVVVSGEDCSVDDCEKIDPSTGDDFLCAATCQLISCYSSSVEGGVFERDCTVSIQVDNHNQLFNYRVIPKLSVDVSNIPDGPRPTASTTISSILPTINFGSFFCGDGNVDIGETQDTCCFDVGCNEGFFCQTKNTGVHTSGDSCMQISGVSMDVSIGQTVFEDTSIEHRTRVNIVIPNLPGGMTVNLDSVRCDLGDGEVACDLEDCNVDSSSSTEYSASCRLRIPPIDFKISSLFNAGQSAVIFSGNLKLSVTFNDGGGQLTNDIDDVFGPITISVQTTCPDAVCDFDESLGQANECPADCGCSQGQFLVLENNGHRGACISEDSINLDITGVSPNPVPCIVTMDNIDINQFKDKSNKDDSNIQQYMLVQKVECVPDPVTLEARIVGGPANIQLIDSSITVDGETMDVSCKKKSGNKYTCPFTMKGSNKFNIFNPALGGASKNVDLHFNTEFTSKDSSTQQEFSVSREISATTTITMDYQLGQDVRDLMACYEEIQNINKDIDNLKKKKSTLQTLVLVIMGIVAVAWITCKLSSGALSKVACKVAAYGTPLALCISAPLLWAVGSTQDKIAKLKDDKSKACASTGIGGLSGSGGGSSGSMAKIFAGISAVLCIVALVNFGAIKGWAGIGGAGNAAPPAGVGDVAGGGVGGVDAPAAPPMNDISAGDVGGGVDTGTGPLSLDTGTGGVGGGVDTGTGPLSLGAGDVGGGVDTGTGPLSLPY